MMIAYGTRGLSFQVKKDLGLRVFHEEKKTSAVSTKCRRYATEHVSLPPEYWDDVISSDEKKIMLYYHDGPLRIWRKPLTTLKNKNFIPSVKFIKLSIIVWMYIQEGSWGNQDFY